jgi:hypothetical protein
MHWRFVFYSIDVSFLTNSYISAVLAVMQKKGGRP